MSKIIRHTRVRGHVTNGDVAAELDPAAVARSQRAFREECGGPRRPRLAPSPAPQAQEPRPSTDAAIAELERKLAARGIITPRATSAPQPGTAPGEPRPAGSTPEAF